MPNETNKANAADSATQTNTSAEGTTTTSAQTNETQSTSAGTTTPATEETPGATLGTIVDKTLDDIKSGVVQDVDTGAKEVAVLARHPAHSILDEMEEHPSQFDARAEAVMFSFLARLRAAI